MYIFFFSRGIWQEKNLKRHRTLANWTHFVQWAPNVRPAFEKRSYWTVVDRFTLIRGHKTPRIRALGNFFEGHRVPQVRKCPTAHFFFRQRRSRFRQILIKLCLSCSLCVITAGWTSCVRKCKHFSVRKVNLVTFMFATRDCVCILAQKENTQFQNGFLPLMLST